MKKSILSLLAICIFFGNPLNAQNTESLFVNTNNTKYAYYNYGTLTFDDGSIISELFNPHLVKINSQVSIAYMYYSSKKNAIMQCKIPF